MADLLVKQIPTFSRSPLSRGGPFLFYGSIGVCAAVLIGIGGLVVLNLAQKAEREEFIAQNTAKEESLRPELLNQIAALERRLKGVRTLITDHLFASNVFGVIEANTHPQVRFVNFTFSADSLKVDMSGEAASYSVLARQIGIFEREPQIERVEFGGLSSTSDGLVGFKLSLAFKPSLLHLRP